VQKIVSYESGVSFLEEAGLPLSDNQKEFLESMYGLVAEHAETKDPAAILLIAVAACFRAENQENSIWY